MRRNLVPTLLALSVSAAVLAVAPKATEVGADTSTPAVTLNSPSANAGNSFGLTLAAANFTKVAGYECSLHYSSSFGVSGNYAGSLVSSSTTTFANPEAGTINFSFMNAAGVTGSGDLLTVYFSVPSSMAIGDYEIQLTIGNVYDTDLNAVSIASSYTQVHVVAGTTYYDTFSVSSSLSKSSLTQNEETIWTINSGYSYGIAAMKLTFTYDSSLLDFVSYTPRDVIKGSDVVASVNSSNPGSVVVTWASTEGKYFSSSFADLVFKSKLNANHTTSLSLTASDCCDKNLKSLKGSQTSASLSLIQSLPKLYATDVSEAISSSFKTTLMVQGSSKVAAMSVAVTYDSSLFVCTSVTGKALDTQTLMIGSTYNAGKITFSFIDTAGISADQSLIEMTFAPISIFHAIASSLTYTVTKPVDVNRQDVSLNVLPTSIALSYTTSGSSFIESWLSDLDDPRQSFTDPNACNVYFEKNETFIPSFDGTTYPASYAYTANPSSAWSRSGSQFTCLTAGYYSFQMVEGFLSISSTDVASELASANTSRSQQFAMVLKKNTDGVTICDANGFLDAKKTRLEALLAEYEAFPTALKNQVATTLCFDSLTCGDVLSILYRGDHKNADPSLGLSLTNSDSYVPVTLFSIAMLGLAFVATGIYIHIRKKTDD